MAYKGLQAATWNRFTYFLIANDKIALFYCLPFFVFSHKWIKNSYSLQYQTHLPNWSWIKPVRWVLSLLVNSSERWCAEKKPTQKHLRKTLIISGEPWIAGQRGQGHVHVTSQRMVNNSVGLFNSENVSCCLFGLYRISSCTFCSYPSLKGSLNGFNKIMDASFSYSLTCFFI